MYIRQYIYEEIEIKGQRERKKEIRHRDIGINDTSLYKLCSHFHNYNIENVLTELIIFHQKQLESNF